MQQLMNFFDQSKKLNQTPSLIHDDSYHPPRNKYKIIHQGLMIPNLPAPLHYFNFLSLFGQPNIPMLLNQNAVLDNNLHNTATVLCSVSGIMHGHLNSYRMQQECVFQHHYYRFGEREALFGKFPNFIFTREDSELSAEIKIKTTNILSNFTRLKFSLFDHWSLLCECEGSIYYNNQKYDIQQLGSFEYARAINTPYMPLCFFTYQIVNANAHQQLLFAQIRNNFNQIVQSRIYLRDFKTGQMLMLDDKVRFIVHRIYPYVQTPNGQKMYLPREFEWQYEDEKMRISLFAQSRGDYKFGLAAGYVGSFSYQLYINEQEYIGDSGYCEYIDCRPLKWQEKNKEEKLLENLANNVPVLLKK